MNLMNQIAYVTAPGTIELREQPLTPPAENEVLIEVRAAAICGSDLHIYKGRHPSAPLPMSLGHEIAGEVVETGSAVTRFAPGDRVTVEPVVACGTCNECRRGRYHLCRSISFQYRQGRGGFARYFLAPQEHTFKIPNHLSFEEGALVEPLSVALHAVKTSEIRTGQTSAIFGAGAIGLLLLMLVQRVSGGETFLVDVSDGRLEMARNLGATYVLNNRRDDSVQRILSETDQAGVDRSFEAVGMESTLVQALQSLKKGGRATLVGIFENPEACLPINLFVQREIALAGSQGYNWDFQDALVLLDQKRLDLKPLITHRLPFTELNRGFDILMAPGSSAIKVVFSTS